ncbi:lantibiotic dehydratase [Nonomuraea sp. NPDC002799]
MLPFSDRQAAGAADAVLDQGELVRRLAQDVKGALRGAGAGDLGTAAGLRRPFLPGELDELRAALGPAASQTVERYQEAALALDHSWLGLERDVAAGLDGARRDLIELFGDPALRQVLLLSNDARYTEFATWLDGGASGSRGHVRRMTDLLAMYLQRVTTKNETNSHFGPLSVARVTPGATGLSWATGPQRRTAYLTHWAGERLAEAFSARPAAFEEVRPRRRPLAFTDGSRIALYAFESVTGRPDGWRFTAVAADTLDDDELWLWRRCDGEHTVARLRAAWQAREDTPLRAFDDVLGELTAKDWLVARWEIPIGSAHPLEVLREQVRDLGDLATVRRLGEQLHEFVTGPLDGRAALLAAMKERFEHVTGAPANRGGGRHYADRGILYEEAYGPVHDMRLGHDVAGLISGELSVVYDLAMLAPRLRVRRELGILRRWAGHRFGAETPIALERFYTAFYADEPELARQCEQVDREIEALDREVTALLLDGHTPGHGETVVERARLARLLSRFPAAPAALCNPDVMLAATDAAALARGDFLAVVGDCHGVREALTHSSFAPLIQQHAPDVLDEIHARYQGLLDDDELLVDLARSHPDKTGAQLVYPCPDLEVYGLSPKSRDQVFQPSDLYLTVRGARIELRAHGTDRRLKLLAPLAGGPSIRQDPLSPFAFPRHFGGIGLRAAGHDRLPRIRCGRAVLQRARWTIPTGALRGWSPGVRPARGDAAEFAAARRLRRDLGLPRHGFVKIPGEPKPVYVDWDSPLLVRQLSRLARQSGATVEFTEMLPGPDQLWLDVNGRRYTSELRCAVFAPRAG